MSWCHKENCGRQISGRHQQQHSYKGGVQLQEVTVPANCLTYNQIIKILFPKICAIMHPIPPFAALATPAAAASASPTSLTPLVPRKPALLSIYSNESCNNLEAYISIPLAYNDTCLVLLGDGFKCNLYDQVGFSGILTSLFSSCLMIANTWAVRTYMDSSCQYEVGDGLVSIMINAMIRESSIHFKFTVSGILNQMYIFCVVGYLSRTREMVRSLVDLYGWIGYWLKIGRRSFRIENLLHET